MTSPVAPDDAPPVPEFPALGDPAYNAKAYTWGSWVPTLVTWITSVAAKAYQNALSAFESATSASVSAASAEASAITSLAGSNFKGDWSSLPVGALNRPASVAHAGRIWLLLSDLPNVAAAEPSNSSPYWRADDSILPLEHITTATASLVAGHHYSVEYAAGQVSLTMPPYVEGSMIYITIANGRYDTVLLRQAPTDSFMGKSPDDLTLTRRTTRCIRGVYNSWRGL
jgi:hypothetical protein